MTRISQDVLFLLLNAMWQVTFVVLLVSVSDRILREARARYRHALWVAALAACVVLLAGSALRISPVRAAPVSLSAAVDHHRSQGQMADNLPMAHVPEAAHSASGRTMRLLAEMPAVPLNGPLALTIAAFYAVLLLYRARVLFRAWARTRSLVRSAQQVELSAQVAEAFERCRHSLNLKRVKILSSTAVAVPVTAGALRPVLILPEHLLEESDVSVLISALGHEGAHILRHDYLLNLAYELAAVPLWFHPAMQFLLRRIRQTRELRCDEIVTEQLVEPRVYAQSLVRLAGAALPFGRPAATMTVGIADADTLEERIMRILKHSPATLRRTRAWPILAALLPVAPCLGAGAFAVHVVIRQPVPALATGQLGGLDSTPVQQSDPGQQPSRQPATATAHGKHLKSPTSMPDGQHRTDTVLVVANRTDSQAPEQSASQEPDSQSGSLERQAPQPLPGVAGGIAGGVKDGIAGGVGDGVTGGTAGGIGGGLSGGVDGGVVGNPPRRPPSQTAKPEHGSPGIAEGNLIQLIEPPYPEKARAAGIQGDVVLEATIAKTGDLEKLRVSSGHPILLAAALDAVKQWKYEPYLLNAKPVEMETTITFKFRLEPRNMMIRLRTGK